MNDSEKKQLVSELAEGEVPAYAGRAKFKVRAGVVHIRFCSANSSNSEQYKFNINKNTLSADFELWICGSKENWYLLPMDLIREMHQHPDAYEDYQHPGLTVVSVYSDTDEVMFARGGVRKSIREYFRANLARVIGEDQRGQGQI